MNTEIIVITDRSGSMQSIRDDVIGGYNRFIEEQQKIKGNARVTYIQFDDQYDEVYSGKDIQNVPTLTRETFAPRGNTALLDAIGKTLEKQVFRILGDKWADKVIVVIITDGQENASREYTREKVRQLTRNAEEAGWKFIYQGANQDSFSVSRDLGIMKGFVNNFVANSVGTQATYTATSATVGNLRSGG